MPQVTRVTNIVQAVNPYLGASRDLFQTLFFICVGAVSILTYLKAKRTLLQPIRTETFKEQLKACSEVLSFFVGKGRQQLWDDFAMDKVFRVNAMRLLDHYATLFFYMKIDENERPYGPQTCPQARIDLNKTNLGFVMVDDHVVRPSASLGKPSPDPRTKAANWGEYTFDMVRIPKEFSEKEAEFRRIMGSPYYQDSLLRCWKIISRQSSGICHFCTMRSQKPLGRCRASTRIKMNGRKRL